MQSEKNSSKIYAICAGLYKFRKCLEKIKKFSLIIWHEKKLALLLLKNFQNKSLQAILSTWEANVRNVINAIDTMLHVHQASSTEVKSASASPMWEERMPLVEQEHALGILESCVQAYGAEALQELEMYVEQLQEEFLAHVANALRERDIHMEEKLVLSLSSDNMLVLQCQEQEEALLAALGEDALLRQRLQTLRSTAFLAKGMQYMLAAKEEVAPTHMAEYNVCVKGQLSHFYLR